MDLSCEKIFKVLNLLFRIQVILIGLIQTTDWMRELDFLFSFQLKNEKKKKFVQCHSYGTCICKI